MGGRLGNTLVGLNLLEYQQVVVVRMQLEGIALRWLGLSESARCTAKQSELGVYVHGASNHGFECPKLLLLITRYGTCHQGDGGHGC
jgi:hypothetical protein